MNQAWEQNDYLGLTKPAELEATTGWEEEQELLDDLIMGTRESDQLIQRE